MSFSESSSEKILLRASAPEPNTEVVIIDSNFRTISRGLGIVERSLNPGIYKVEFRAGDSTSSEYAVLKPGSDPVEVVGPVLEFSSPAPIARTKTSRESHMMPASRLSRESQNPLGEGSGLFIFVRDIVDAPGPRKNPARGVSLHDLDGEKLVDVDGDGEYNVEQQWAGVSLDVEPGLYRLRVRTDVVGSLEQIIVASPRWQTQVFMLQRRYLRDDEGRRRSESRRRADPFNASVMMTRLDRETPDLVDGFDPGEEELRKIELARLGLAEQRQVMPQQQLHEILWEKYKDPMLGIYGGHLLLLEQKPNLEELETVTNNLRRLVGDHPDVMALAVKLALLKGQVLSDFAPFETPPMLRSSWQILVEASSHYPALVPAGSLAAQISSAIWAEGAWLTWRVQDIAPAAETEEIDQAALKATVDQLAGRLSDPEWLRKIESGLSLNSLELGLLRQLVNVAYLTKLPERLPMRFRSRAALDVPPQETPSEEDILSDEALVQALGAPSASISQAAEDLRTKLDSEF